MTRTIWPALMGLFLLTACGSETTSNEPPATAPQAKAEAQSESVSESTESSSKGLQSAIDGTHRSEANKARDRYRNPQETLAFLGVEPDMTVVEIWPGAGWYTEILAPYLRESGEFYAAGFAVSEEGVSPYLKKVQGQYMTMLESRPALYDKVTVTELGLGEAWFPAPEETADRVLTFRNVHNWVKGGFANAMFDSFFRTLKPGGILGVIEHRAKPGTDLETMKSSGYVTEALVKELAAKAGFEFVGASEINANARDDRDHPEGVWTLPPSLRGDKADREQYQAIGESDRMTLKFRRPTE